MPGMGYLLRHGLLQRGWERGTVQFLGGLGLGFGECGRARCGARNVPLLSVAGMGVAPSPGGAANFSRRARSRARTRGVDAADTPNDGDQLELDKEVAETLALFEDEFCDCAIASDAYQRTQPWTGEAQWCVDLCCETPDPGRPCNCGEVTVCVDDTGPDEGGSGTTSQSDDGSGGAEGGEEAPGFEWNPHESESLESSTGESDCTVIVGASTVEAAPFGWHLFIVHYLAEEGTIIAGQPDHSYLPWGALVIGEAPTDEFYWPSVISQEGPAACVSLPCLRGEAARINSKWLSA